MRRDPEEHRRRRQCPGERPDAEVRKPGERTGLDTPVVLAVNDDHQVWEVSTPSVPKGTH